MPTISIKLYYARFETKNIPNEIAMVLFGDNDNILFISNITFSFGNNLHVVPLKELEHIHKTYIHPIVDYESIKCKQNSKITYVSELDEDDVNYVPYNSDSEKINNIEMIRDNENNEYKILMIPDIYNDSKYFYPRFDLSLSDKNIEIDDILSIINVDLDNILDVDFIYDKKMSDKKTKNKLISHLIKTQYFDNKLKDLNKIETKKLNKNNKHETSILDDDNLDDKYKFTIYEINDVFSF
jgi:hypothetical protein